MNDFLLVERVEEGILALTLNRPEKRNALTISLLKALKEAVLSAEKNKERVIFLKGTGEIFCAGLDLKEAANKEKAEESAVAIADTLKTLATSPVISIAVAKGAAIAGGAGLLAACDLAITTPGCSIGYPETRRGLVAGLVMTFILRQIGEKRARDLLFTGRMINGETALLWGLTTAISSEEEIEKTALDFARQICLGAPEATAQSKALLEKIRPPTIDQDLALALQYHKNARNSKEAYEGIAAFLEKRNPSWKFI